MAIIDIDTSCFLQAGNSTINAGFCGYVYKLFKGKVVAHKLRLNLKQYILMS